jgi:pimeloyl-ACP methyl ester carboxylesterase
MSTMRAHKIQLATGLAYNVCEWDGHGDTSFVLVHGFTDLGAGWCEVAPLLAPHGNVLAPDMRGHGDSDRIGPGGYYHFFDYVADLDEVIRHLARPRVVLVGHSMGGSIASYYAGTRPERISRLALLEGLGPPDQSDAATPTRTAMWIDAWRAAASHAPKPMPTLEDAAQRLRRADDLLDEALARKLAHLGTREVPGGYRWKHDPLHLTMGPYPFRLDVARRHWERITCPVLIVDGARSRLNLSEAERAARRACFANHRHLVIDDAGHALQRHQPARVAAALLELAA